VLAAAVDTARAAVVEAAGRDAAGAHLGVSADDERVVTHRFACLLPGYASWEWSVTLVRVSRSRTVTVNESCLLPGATSVLAPAWVPWSQRVEAGDLGPGDLLVTPPDDPRLVPGYTGEDAGWPGPPDVDDELAEIIAETGLGRARVLSLTGVDEAVDRWTNGPGGPSSPLAVAAPGRCASCGFVVRLGGLLGQAFGACANELSPSDGRVVTYDHGCGAHSEAAAAALSPAGAMTLDEVGYDALEG